MKVLLPEDGWALIRDPRTLTERLTARLQESQLTLMALPVMEQYSNPEDFEKIQDLRPLDQMRLIGRDGFKIMREMKWETVLVYTKEWSYGAVTLDVLLDDVPSIAVDALAEEIGKVIRATGGPQLDTSPSPDADSPTPPLTV